MSNAGGTSDKLLLITMSTGRGWAEKWSLQELSAIYRHQLATDLSSDLAGEDSVAMREVHELSPSRSPAIRTYADLLFHPTPPLRLLKMVEHFAKAHRDSDLSSLPKELSSMLYFVAIVVARLRCGASITTLTDAGLQVTRRSSIAQAFTEL